MQFTCSTSSLIEALQIATKALAGRTTNQILEGVLIETDKSPPVEKHGTSPPHFHSLC